MEIAKETCSLEQIVTADHLSSHLLPSSFLQPSVLINLWLVINLSTGQKETGLAKLVCSLQKTFREFNVKIECWTLRSFCCKAYKTIGPSHVVLSMDASLSNSTNKLALCKKKRTKVFTNFMLLIRFWRKFGCYSVVFRYNLRSGVQDRKVAKHCWVYLVLFCLF